MNIRTPWVVTVVLISSIAAVMAETPATLAATSEVNAPEAAEFQCQLLASTKHAAEAAACYTFLLGEPGIDPARSAEFRLNQARNQSWSGQGGRAIDNYDLYLRLRPDDREATIEFIRLLRYRGSYERAEKLCDGWLDAHPNDSSVLALKAELLHWAGGRLKSAASAARQAVTLAPDLPDARLSEVYVLRDAGLNRAARRRFDELKDQINESGGVAAGAAYSYAYRYLENEFADSGRPEAVLPFSTYNDADGIHNTFTGLEFTTPWYDDHTLQLKVDQYTSSAPLSGLFTAGRDRATVREFAAGGTVWSGYGASVTALGGASTRLGSANARPIFELRATASPFDRWTFELVAGREFLKITPRAIDLDMSSYQVSAGARYAFNSRTLLETHAGRRWFSDANRSVTTDATLTRTLRYSRPFMVRTGLLTRYEAFDRDTRFASGFFTPDQYWRHDTFLSAHGEAGRLLTWELMGSGGVQRVIREAAYRPSWGVAAVAGIRITRSLRLFANYQLRNYSLLATQGWYQGFYISLGVRP